MTPPPPPEERQRDRVLVVGRPNLEQCDNTIITARYTLLTFLPVAIREQFRRFANQYFLVVGIIMGVGYYIPSLFESAISPWTTLGPLAFVISISLLVEGSADFKRHKNDYETNSAPCIIMRNVDEWEAAHHSEKDGGGEGHHVKGEREPSVLNGQDVTVNLAKPFHSNLETPMANSKNPNAVRVAFQRVYRKDIRQGHLVLVRNREMVPADIILLASSSDNGSAYIETSSIDGETNLKLRTSPHLPKSVLKLLREKTMQALPEEESEDSTQDEGEDEDGPHVHETLEQATKRITRLSALANPSGISALEHPNYVPGEVGESEEPEHRRSSLLSMVKGIGSAVIDNVTHTPNSRAHMAGNPAAQETNKYLAALTSEPPNPHVNTFTGKLTFPPVLQDGNAVGACVDVPLGAENILLRGAVIRNTEWVIGVACFTGTDTKLVQNSVKPPSKFSRLDKLMNRTVTYIIGVMVLCISYLATQSVVTSNREFDYIWYLGYNKEVNEPWPYLPNLAPPAWETKTRNWAQVFFLYVTLLNNFVPLSLYVTVEIITFCMLALIYVDLDMYDDTTDTRAVARSTIVTDLGQVQYIFSDKTGTLTQNVMRFKRCSVDGLVFGAPIQKTRPGMAEEAAADQTPQTPFHPLRQLLVGRISVSETPTIGGMLRHASPGLLPGLEQFGVEVSTDYTLEKKLTFNAEMFLRVMSLCHTVVVEKDLDQKTTIDSDKTVNSSGSIWSVRASLYAKKLLGTKQSGGDARGSSTIPRTIGSPLAAVSEEGDDNEDFSKHSDNGNRYRFDSTGSALSIPGSSSGKKMPMEKGADGAPMGYAYQAESPDEGALVEAASARFGFQVIGRDSSGIKLRSTSASHLLDARVVQGLKNGTVTPKSLAADTAAEPLPTDEGEVPEPTEGSERYETWSILAVNKFDSDRKRMSILLRSPVEMGEIPILFCKGADSAMLDPSVCSGAHTLVSGDGVQEDIAQSSNKKQIPKRIEDDGIANGRLSVGSALDAEEQDEWEMAQMLGIQAHLGDFASEGLRTLVLGMRVLTENECTEWLEKYKEAATSIKNREERLKEAALLVERDLHIVGATAIEDKLQKGVPDAIATLGKAGIKLWVLTGDKRETAIEIGYSTHVLTPKMHLTEAADKGENYVRTQIAMEFIRLVKSGKLPLYQRSVVDQADEEFTWENFMFKFGKFSRSIKRSIRRSLAKLSRYLCFKDPKDVAAVLQVIDAEAADEANILKATERRRRVRNRAEKVIRDFLISPEGQLQRTRRAKTSSRPTSPLASARGLSDDGDDDIEELTLTSDDLPSVFNRAQSARTLLDKRKSQGRLSQSERRTLAIAQLTVQELGGDPPLVDEDALSLNSFFVGDKNATSDFDKKKRTILERLFAVDKEVRKGRLLKHVRKEKLAAITEESREKSVDDHGGDADHQTASDGPRALVIEGAALKHLLGDPELEEIIFSVASSCDAVIACRVSPKQKALLVSLVRQNVVPEPVTLAIGDGANDVGMIQEAHVGVGISGKEGKQAVNSSDFAIAQFRFLEDLLLIHGRWNFFRMTTVVLFSFYKNAILAGCLISYTAQSLYSGTPLFDQWIIAMLNFVAGIPIIVLGLFDRCLDKSYIRRHPEVYKPTRNNELLTIRTQLRWIILVFVHLFSIYYMTVPTLAREGGGISSAWLGLMRNKGFDSPGDGEGGDLKSVGTVTFTCLILLLAYKVLFESRSLIHGMWPAFTFRKNVGEGFTSRLAYTWIGVVYCSIGFYLIFLATYQALGRKGAGTFSEFVDTANHVLATRSINWMLITFVPIFAMAFDVSAKVFSNMFYPTQTQIHIELEAREKRNRRLGIGEHNFRLRTSVEA